MQSTVSVYLDVRQAAAAFRAAATRAFLTCVTAHFAKQLARFGPVRVTLKRMTAGPPLGTPSRTFRAGYLLKWHGHALVYRYDASVFEVDSAVASVASWSVGGPYRPETDLVRRVASRL